MSLIFCKYILSFLLITFSSMVDGLEHCGWKQCHQRNESLPIGVHIIPFSHTSDHFTEPGSVVFDKYIRIIYTNILKSLTSNRNRTFVVSDVGLFAKWFETLSWDDRVDLYQTVSNEQLTFVSGFWATLDECVTHYYSIINDITLGNRWLQKFFRECGHPIIAWQLNALGHSTTFAEVLIESGYEGLFFSRTDHHYKNALKENHSLIFNWQPQFAGTTKKADSILTIVTPDSYSSPPAFSFESNWFPISQEELNAGATEEFVNYVKGLTTTYATSEVFVLLGGDFTFRSSEIHYKSIDALIEAVQNDPSYGVDIFYSSPNCYYQAIKHGNPGLPDKPFDPLSIFNPTQPKFKTNWPTKNGKDFLPVTDADDPTKVFSGYYSTNPSLKHEVRQFESLLMSVSQLESIKSILRPETKTRSEFKLMQEMAALQTLNGVGSVSSFSSLNETNARLTKSFNDGLTLLSNTFMDILDIFGSNLPEISVCQNPSLQTCLVDGDIELLKSGVTVYVYNPLTRKEVEFVRVSVPKKLDYTVTNWQGYEITSQLFKPLQRGLLVKDSNETVPDEYHLYFKAILPPLGITSFMIKEIASSTVITSHNANSDNFISNSKLKVIFNQETGSLESVLIIKTSQLVSLKQKFIAYKPSLKSSHLVFDPEGTGVELLTSPKLVSVNRGLIVQEVNHIVNDFINQTVRLYQGKDFIEIDYQIGLLPNDTVGMELITRFESDLSSNSFTTFSNCREVVERKVEVRTKKLPESSIGKDFFPATCYTSVKDTFKNIQMNVFVDRSLAVSSMMPGSVDFLIQRRIPFKNELIGEEVNYEKGTFFTTWINFEKDSVELNKFSKKLLWKPVTFFSHQPQSFDSENVEQINHSFLNQTVDRNLHLLTMETFKPLDPDCTDKQLLLRIENTSTNQTLTLNPEYLFKNVRIFKAVKLDLAARSDVKWRAPNEVRNSFKIIDTTPADVSTITTDSTEISIEPYQIETLIVSFNKIVT